MKTKQRFFEVILNGRNYLIEMDGKVKKHGFFVTRYITANNPDVAEDIAVNIIRNTDSLNKLIQNKKSDPPMLYLEAMYELDSFDGINNLEPGFGYYDETEKE